jgi:hypothetical protein
MKSKMQAPSTTALPYVIAISLQGCGWIIGPPYR